MSSGRFFYRSRVVTVKTKRAVVSLCAIAYLLFAAVGAEGGERDGALDLLIPPTIWKPSVGDGDMPNILKAMVLMYTSSRNAVMQAYDEILYWRGVNKSYEFMEDWIRSQQRVEDVNIVASRLIPISVKYDDVNIWARLGQAEALYNEMVLLSKGPREFERAISAIEIDWENAPANSGFTNAWITASGDGSRRLPRRPYATKAPLVASTTGDYTYTPVDPLASPIGDYDVGVSPPVSTTSEKGVIERVAEQVDKFYLSAKGTSSRNPAVRNTVLDASYLSKRDSVPEAMLFDVTRAQVISSFAKSEYYYAWSVNAMENIARIEKSIDVAVRERRGDPDPDDPDPTLSPPLRSIPQIEIQTAWYRLEEANAKNVKIRHSIEELKLYMAALGLDLNQATRVRADELSSVIVARDIANMLRPVVPPPPPPPPPESEEP